MTARILARHPRPSFYFDEPVSGYANEVFNGRFTQAGALCLHFQTAWVPGFGFFTRDKAQSKPVELNLCDDGDELATEHVARRDAGGGLPLYMMGYGRYSKRAKDLGITLGKAACRATARRNANYIDRDPEAHIVACPVPDEVVRRRDTKSIRSSAPIRNGQSSFRSTTSRRRCYSISVASLDRKRSPRGCSTHCQPTGRWSIKEHPSQPGALRLPKWRDIVRAARVIPLAGTYPGARLLAASRWWLASGVRSRSKPPLPVAARASWATCISQTHPASPSLTAPEDWPSAFQGPCPDREGMTEWYGRFMQRYAFSGNFQQGKTWIERPAALIAALQDCRCQPGLNP